jgi:hypothetical protein
MQMTRKRIGEAAISGQEVSCIDLHITLLHCEVHRAEDAHFLRRFLQTKPLLIFFHERVQILEDNERPCPSLTALMQLHAGRKLLKISNITQG